jgi:hypothetical protein
VLLAGTRSPGGSWRKAVGGIEYASRSKHHRGSRAAVPSSELPDHNSGWRHLVLINNTRATIAEIYVSDDGAGVSQEDILGAEFLLAGS